MILARHAGDERPAKGGMEAERGGHRLGAVVGNRGADREPGAVERVGHIELEREGIARAGLVIGAQSPGAARRARLHQLERRCAREAVAQQWIVLPTHGDAVVLHVADDWEQQRRAAGPDIGIAVPQQLFASSGVQALQLRAARRHDGAESPVLKCDDIDHVQPLTATSIAPIAIRATPAQFTPLNRSPRKITPNSATSTTLSLSIGATRAASPSLRARK